MDQFLKELRATDWDDYESEVDECLWWEDVVDGEYVYREPTADEERSMNRGGMGHLPWIRIASCCVEHPSHGDILIEIIWESNQDTRSIKMCKRGEPYENVSISQWDKVLDWYWRNFQ